MSLQTTQKRAGRRLGRVPASLLCAAGLLACPALLPGQVAPPSAAPAAAAANTTTAASGSAVSPATATPAADPASLPANSPEPKVAGVTGKSPAPTLETEIARLPPLTGTGIDVATRSKEILDHLNSVLRLYRTALTPMQKIGEPSDVLYAEQSSTEATQIAQLAFEAAKNEAALLSRVVGSTAPASAGSKPAPPKAPGEAQRLATAQAQAQARAEALEAQETALAQQLGTAHGAERAALLQAQQQVEGGLELQRAMVDALGRISTFSDAQSSTGLAGDIDRLQRSAPELLNATVKPPTPPLLQSLASLHDAGVTTQAEALFQLLGTLRDIDGQISAIDALSKGANDLRTPFVKVLRSTVQQGQTLMQAAAPAPTAAATTAAPDADGTRKQFDTLTTTFEVLANATMPLSQEVVVLGNARATLTTWQSVVVEEKNSILRWLLLRVAVIAVALGILALASNLWSRATVRYVSDLRRRRQILFVRRAVIGSLSGLVLILGFVTQFSSLATFAGFITAGIAVGLQSILLSIAAYFFIVGRYGVRVGDRITVASVTGDVIEVGLVRFYMMELVGTGTELHSTGRVAVFANSILFQTGTPIYKQMPGTEYAWHELTAKLNGNADVGAVSGAILGAVNEAYAGYSARIEGQHQQVESWMGTALPAPKVESRLQLVDGGLQFAALFPVQLNDAAATDQGIAEALVKAMKADGPLKTGLTELPVIKAAVKT